MRTKSLILSALATCLILTGGLTLAQPPEGGRPGGRGEGRGPGRPGGPGPGAMFRPGQILPPMMVQRLGLSTEQIEKLEVLQAEVNEKLTGILTEEQQDQMKQMAARAQQRAGQGRGPGGRGPGAEGRRPGGERRGPDAEGRRPRGDREPGAGRGDGQRRRGGDEEPRS